MLLAVFFCFKLVQNQTQATDELTNQPPTYRVAPAPGHLLIITATQGLRPTWHHRHGVHGDPEA